MANRKELKSLRTIFLSLLFLPYYGFIFLLCWVFVSSDPRALVSQMLDLKVLQILFSSGCASGLLLFISAMPAIDFNFKRYWAVGNWQGLIQTSIYLTLNVALVLFPVLISQHSYVLIRYLTLPFLLLGILACLFLFTYNRFKGLNKNLVWD